MISPKITRMLMLTIALTGTVCLLDACGKTRTSYIVRGKFNYINHTKENLRIMVRGQMVSGSTLQQFEIKSNDTLTLLTEGETDFLTADPEGYVPAISGDTTTIVIADTLCYKEYNRKGVKLQNIKAYTYQKVSDRSYIFNYELDSSIVKLASQCP